MEIFQCDKCGLRFESEGRKFEYNSPVYGPCSKKIADCPQCGNTSDEYRPPKRSKSRPDPGPASSCPYAQGGRCCPG